MAQLPPKAPTAAVPEWPGLGGHQPPPWAIEFADFSATRRVSHRRAVSDPVAFFEVDGGAAHDLDHLDDDQLMSMFADAPPPPASPSHTSAAKSPPSDDNSVNGEQPSGGEPEERQSGCKLEPEGASPRQTAATEIIADPKRVKRILANRQSAQRSRVRKLQYISELERSVTTLQMEVSALSPRVAYLDQQRSLLTVGNSHLKQRIAALAQDNLFKDAHQEALKKEIERLRHVYQQQSLKKTGDPRSDPPGHDEGLLGCESEATRLCPPS